MKNAAWRQAPALHLLVFVGCLLLAGCGGVPGGAPPRAEDPAQAAQRYEAEYRQGSIMGGLRYATMLAEGSGVPKDEQKAFAIFSELAERNVPAALHNVGTCYEYGQGTEKDMKKAEEAYRRAADAGILWSMYNLGILYSNRLAQDGGDVEGLALLLRAKRLAIGKSDAEKAIRDDRAGHVRKMIGRMTPTQIADAEALSRK